ncbi:hypothetical protein K1W54_04515 [Micromonospora sp. CPCC 205371]|nr:hypothetical protein [Micromonospora sp. CPCC 205371]
MADEVSNAELARRLGDFATDVRGDFAEVFRRLDSYVLREVYHAEKAATEVRLAALEVKIGEERQARVLAEERQRAAVRWWWSAVLIPTIALITSIVLQAAKP